MKKIWTRLKKTWCYTSPKVFRWITNIGASIAAISSLILAADVSWIPESYLPIARQAFGFSLLISGISKLTVTKECAIVIEKEIAVLEKENKI